MNLHQMRTVCKGCNNHTLKEVDGADLKRDWCKLADEPCEIVLSCDPSAKEMKPTKKENRGIARKGKRTYPDAYPAIIILLESDREKGGIGLNAYALSKEIGLGDMTTRHYCTDLVKAGKIVKKRILSQTVYLPVEKNAA